MNQYQRILQHMGKRWMTYHALMVISNCPWRRISELEKKGYVFERDWTVKTKEHKRVRLVRLLHAPRG